MTRLCEKHDGDGTMHPEDAFWLCDVCSTEGIDQCHCGGIARYFGEALMQSISCNKCDESLMVVGDEYDVRKMWNEGIRGYNEQD